MALHVEGSKEPLLTNSLVLSAASPFLCTLLSSLSHCDGCTSRKSIILAEEQMDSVEGLLDLLHAKYLKQATSTLVHVGPDFEKLCQRLAIQEIESLSTPLSRLTSDVEADRHPSP